MKGLDINIVIMLPVLSLLSIFTTLPFLRYHYKCALIKAHKLKTQRTFLKSCKEERIVPQLLMGKRLQDQSQSPFGILEEEIQHRAITATSWEIEEAFSQSRSSLQRLRSVCSDDGVFSFLRNKAIQMCNKQVRLNASRLENKCQRNFRNDDTVLAEEIVLWTYQISS